MAYFDVGETSLFNYLKKIMLGLKTNQRAFSAVSILRLSIGAVYFWFGVLKFFHGYSPAEVLATKPIHALALGLINDQYSIILLAIWECLVGLLFISGKWIRIGLMLLFLHMVCTFTPLFLLPADSFKYAPYGLAMIGQYIIKNLIIIAGALVVGQDQKLRRNQLFATEHKPTLLILDKHFSKYLQKTV